MRKVYSFNQLSKNAKKKAAEEVHERNQYEVNDWSIEDEQLTESIMEDLKSLGLECNAIYWDSYYGTIDLTSVTMNDDYLKKVLSKNEFKLYEDLVEVTDGFLEHKLFKKEYRKDGYELVFNYRAGGFDELTAMKFISKYSKDDDIKIKYKLPLLLESELSEEEYDDLVVDTEELGIKLAESLEEKINFHIEEMVDKYKKWMSDHSEYIGSEQYYYDRLNEEAYPDTDDYLFNYQGELIIENGDFVEQDYEEVYHNCVA